MPRRIVVKCPVCERIKVFREWFTFDELAKDDLDNANDIMLSDVNWWHSQCPKCTQEAA
jgi:hypothetical protein